MHDDYFAYGAWGRVITMILFSLFFLSGTFRCGRGWRSSLAVR